ncbi:MAG: 16S rRNA (cytosine(1402)-N(4))-methyltransferase RsmH [Candidatus Omnitrophota bacterium]
MKRASPHKPVMVNEVIEFLQLKNGYKVLDATVGCGGHAGFILQKILPGGLLIGIDRDKKSLEIARNYLRPHDKTYRLVQANFKDIDKTLGNLGIEKIDAALFDLGLSSYQIEDPSRGFSFKGDGYLDMRMDPSQNLSAYDIVNRGKREDLERIIRDFGEERYFRRLTDFILDRRKKAALTSTSELADLIKKAVGRRYASQRIHPATRTFQALRIAVNRELDNLDEVLGKVLGFLGPGARLSVISYHSLEDRIVKTRFKEFEKVGEGRILTKKPLTPGAEEIRENPRSRSAKLRAFSAFAKGEIHSR